MGLSMVITQVTMPISLSMVGVLNGLFDPGQVYAGSLLVWAGILPMIAALRYHSIGGGGRDVGMVASIREGIRYARASAAISGILLVVVVVQFAGMPVATPLGPVFMIEVLDFTTAQVGFMGMTWGLGSLAASFLLARFRWLTLRGDTLAAMTLAFGGSIVRRLVIQNAEHAGFTRGAGGAVDVVDHHAFGWVGFACEFHGDLK